jgi:hypothetical protein
VSSLSIIRKFYINYIYYNWHTLSVSHHHHFLENKNISFVFLASLYSLQDALLFQPNEPDTSRTIVQPPSLFRMPYETIIIETDDNEKLHGFLIKQMHRANECETLVFFHGNAGNIGHRYD